MNTDLGIIIAIVGVGIAMVAVVIAMMFWVRQESNDLRKEQKEDRKDLLQIGRNLEILVDAIREDVKDFHGRLCAIEERNKK